jgi:glycosyltransferase involved in cell wall biosynthesis
LTAELAAGLERRGHRVRLLCGAGKGFEPPYVLPWLEPSLEPERDLFAETYRGTNQLAWRRHVHSPHNLAATRRALASEPTDVLLATNLGLASLAPLAAAREAGVPILGFICDTWPLNHWLSEWRSRGNKRLRQWLLQTLIQRRQRRLGAWPMLVPSAFLERELVSGGIAPDRLRRFTLGVPPLLPSEPPAPRPRAAHEPLRLLISSASWEGKGAHVALEAVARARGLGANLELILCGDGPGPYRERLAKLAADPRLRGHVQMLGRLPQQEVFALAEGCHGALFPSLWGEPFARAPIEALWLGLALMASDAGGTPELFTHGESGLCLAAGDLEAWVQALLGLWRDEPRRLALAKAGQQLARTRHGPEQMLERIEAEVRELVSGAAQTRADRGR